MGVRPRAGAQHAPCSSGWLGGAPELVATLVMVAKRPTSTFRLVRWGERGYKVSEFGYDARRSPGAPMNPTIDILRAELERLFSLDEMTSMSERLLGLDPDDVGGATAKASFAKALAERCVDGDRIDALVDVLVASRPGVDARLRDVAGLLGRDEIAPGETLGPFVVSRKLGEGALGVVYTARHGDQDTVLKVLRCEASRDKRAVQRFLTATRMVAALDHPGLPRGLEAGETDGTYWVSYDAVDAQPLSARFSRTGPSHFTELKPILRGILEPLAALHKARIAHGDLKLENVLVGRHTAAEGTSPASGSWSKSGVTSPGGTGETMDGPSSARDPSQNLLASWRVLLVDAGTDRLRQRSVGSNGHSGALAVFGSPKTISPEQVRGLRADAAADIYAFGAMMYELLSGRPVFPYETGTDAALAHVA
jgi:hypothetical protein